MTDDDHDVAPPDGCQTTLEHERRFTATADFCESEARRLAEVMTNDPEAKLGTTITKLMAEALKARRAASALARAREDDAEARRIEALEAAMSRSNAH